MGRWRAPIPPAFKDERKRGIDGAPPCQRRVEGRRIWLGNALFHSPVYVVWVLGLCRGEPGLPSKWVECQAGLKWAQWAPQKWPSHSLIITHREPPPSTLYLQSGWSWEVSAGLPWALPHVLLQHLPHCTHSAVLTPGSALPLPDSLSRTSWLCHLRAVACMVSCGANAFPTTLPPATSAEFNLTFSQRTCPLIAQSKFGSSVKLSRTHCSVFLY